MSESERRLTSAVCVDIVGYDDLVRSSNMLAPQLLEKLATVMRPIITSRRGREIKTVEEAKDTGLKGWIRGPTGATNLSKPSTAETFVEFGSPVDAVTFAVEVQRALRDYNRTAPRQKELLARIGLHVGELVHQKGEYSGEVVAVASRIQLFAAPGGVCVSRQTREHVRNRIPYRLDELKSVGAQQPSEYGVCSVVMPWDEEEVSLPAQLDKRRIAVLPFANMSSSLEEGYFADGMTEEVITSLSGVRQLTVIARTSVMKYKGSQKGASDVGKELNAGSLIEGSVRKAGNRVRITAQLIDTATEGHLWAQNYDRQFDDIFAIQSEIAEKVAGELRIRLVDSEKRAIEKKPTENTEAYTYYLRGRELAREETKPSLKQAVGLFEKAVKLDPSYARAHSALAECFIILANNSYEPYEQAISNAKLSVKKALDLEPELAEAHATLAGIHFLEDDVSSCEVEAKRALELNPSLPEAYRALANVASLKGDGDEAMRLREALYRLDPVKPRHIELLGSYYFFMGKESEALQLWEKTAQLAPAGTCRNMSEYYLFKGNYEKAKELYSKAEEPEPANHWARWMGGFIAARMGDKNAAIQAIRKIEENWTGAADLNAIGFIHYALGDLDSYFTYMNRATDQHLLEVQYVMYCPLLAKGRSDPRYQELMDKLRKMHKIS